MNDNIILSAFADECCDSLDGQIRALGRLGVDRLEIRGVNGKNISELTDGEIRSVADKLSDAGISVPAIGSPIGKIAADGDIDAHIKTAHRVFGAATALGAKYVRVFSFYPGNLSGTAYESAVIGHTARLISLADGFGVTLCHENEAGIFGESPGSCRSLIDVFDGRLKCVFDMGNFVLGGYDPLEAYGLLSDSIAYFHVKDATRDGAIVPPGCGDAQIAGIIGKHIAGGNVPVAVTLEPHLHGFVGLSGLTRRDYSLPYTYPDGEAAMADAKARFEDEMARLP